MDTEDKQEHIRVALWCLILIAYLVFAAAAGGWR
jgi:hypothetical protein